MPAPPLFAPLLQSFAATPIEVRAVRSVYSSLEDIFVNFTRRMACQASPE